MSNPHEANSRYKTNVQDQQEDSRYEEAKQVIHEDPQALANPIVQKAVNQLLNRIEELKEENWRLRGERDDLKIKYQLATAKLVMVEDRELLKKLGSQ